ncbi:MAG: hypothetical protein MI746_14230 [Pseudomonadales bacterium]|nr:hypothetical protein [Pseudomonadales bacterium]
MELVVYFFAVMAVGTVLFLLLCVTYFALTARPAALALKLSYKLAFGALAGLLLLGFGAILLPAIWINAAIEPLPNYSRWRDIAAAFVISTIGAVATYLAVFWFAWGILD